MSISTLNEDGKSVISAEEIGLHPALPSMAALLLTKPLFEPHLLLPQSDLLARLVGECES